MLLSARSNQFRFSFPRSFIPPEVADKYRPYFNRIPGGLIKEPIDYWNYGIQSINLPGVSYSPVEQEEFRGGTKTFRGSLPIEKLYGNELTVTMQGFDGWINYWMAFDTFNYYYNLTGKFPHLPEGNGIQILDGEGNALVTVRLKEMIWSSISSLDLNFSSNTVEFQTFDLGFNYNLIDFKIDLV